MTPTAACAVIPVRCVSTAKTMLTATCASAKTPMRTRVVVSVLVSVYVCMMSVLASLCMRVCSLGGVCGGGGGGVCVCVCG